MPTSDGAELVAVGVGDAALTTIDAPRRRGGVRPGREGDPPASGWSSPGIPGISDAEAGAVITEGILLARYTLLRPEVGTEGHAARCGRDRRGRASVDELTDGIRRGVVTSRSAALARDLANAPPSHLTATDLADIAAQLGGEFGFDVESYDKAQLIEMGCGGLLGVNAGSAEEPRMIRLSYTPAAAAANGRHVAFVGKGIMYDSGGISLKPSDPMHLLMKMDMGGAAAVLGAVTALRDLGLPHRRDGVPVLHRQHAVGLRLQARRRAHRAQRHHHRGEEHRCRGSPGHVGRSRARQRRASPTPSSTSRR